MLSDPEKIRRCLERSPYMREKSVADSVPNNRRIHRTLIATDDVNVLRKQLTEEARFNAICVSFVAKIKLPEVARLIIESGNKNIVQINNNNKTPVDLADYCAANKDGALALFDKMQSSDNLNKDDWSNINARMAAIVFVANSERGMSGDDIAKMLDSIKIHAANAGVELKIPESLRIPSEGLTEAGKTVSEAGAVTR